MMNNSNVTSCDDVTCLRHPHWQQFHEPPYHVHITLGIIMSLMSILSISGNMFVIFIYCRYKCLWTPSHVLLLNLCVSDLCMAITGFPLYIISSFSGKWPFPPQVCEFYGFAGGVFGLISICTLASISLDRYYVIVRSNRKRLSYKLAYSMLVFSWFYSICLAMPPLFGWNKYTWEGFATTCSFDYLTRTFYSRLFILIMFLFGFVVPLIVITYCYIYIFLCVYKRRQNLHSGTTHLKVIKGGKEQSRRQVEIETARSILCLIGLYCISWIPYSVVALIGVFGDQSLITPMTSAVPGLFAKASTIYNPFVYGICLPKFRLVIRSFFLRLCCGINGNMTYLEDMSSRYLANSSCMTDSPSIAHTQGTVRSDTLRSSLRRSCGSIRSTNGRKASLIVRYKKVETQHNCENECTPLKLNGEATEKEEIEILKRLLNKNKLKIIMNNDKLKIVSSENNNIV